MLNKNKTPPLLSCLDFLPAELNVFVDAGGDAHGDYGVIPRADEHERQAQAHTEERQSPVGEQIEIQQ